MGINADKPLKWKEDIAQSVDFYNDWFLKFAPEAYRTTRVQTTKQVEEALEQTNNLSQVTPAVLKQNPSILPILRMSTAPPLARDRLIGLAQVPPSLVRRMEIDQRLPVKGGSALDTQLGIIAGVILRLLDRDIFPWVGKDPAPSEVEVHRTATIVADRLCGSVADPIIRNAQEKRQLAAIKAWLLAHQYRPAEVSERLDFRKMMPGTFSFRLNVHVKLEGGVTQINIPIDAVIMPKNVTRGELPLLVEARSAGDFTNTNKRRKEEAIKMSQLKQNYGSVRFVLFLAGYFNTGYLGYEAAEGIDWVWEHRIDDFLLFGL